MVQSLWSDDWNIEFTFHGKAKKKLDELIKEYEKQLNSATKDTEKIQTIGDNNAHSLMLNNNVYRIDETITEGDQVIGKAVLKIPYLGWAKLIFFDWRKPEGERGFCNEN